MGSAPTRSRRCCRGSTTRPERGRAFHVRHLQPAGRPRRAHRRGQGHRRRLRPHPLPRRLALGLDDHPQAASRRGRRRALPLRRRRRVRAPARGRRAPRVGRRARPGQVRHPARAGRRRAGRRGARRCWRSTCRAPARCASGCPRRCSCSSRRRAGTSWSAGWSAGAPRPRRSARRRLATAREELAAQREFDVTIVNDDVRRASEELVSLMRAPSSWRRRAGSDPVTTPTNPTERD